MVVVVGDLQRTRRQEQAHGELAGFAGPALLAQACDERLAALVRDGDKNAFAAIVARYRAELERHCRRMLPAARAEDALQQALASAYVALSRGARPAALRPWLYAIARNAAIDGLRERQAECLDDAGEIGGLAQTHDIVAGRESLRSVVRAVADLPERQREVIVRQEFEGLSQEQIAADLGLTAGAVRQLAHRARASVRAAAAALVPAPLWRLLPWQLSPTGSGGVVAGSALGAIAGKAAIVLVAATAAGGALQVASGHPAAPSRPPAHVAAPRVVGAPAGLPPAAGADERAVAGSSANTVTATAKRHAAVTGAPSAPGRDGAGSSGGGTPSAAAAPAGRAGDAPAPGQDQQPAAAPQDGAEVHGGASHQTAGSASADDHPSAPSADAPEDVSGVDAAPAPAAPAADTPAPPDDKLTPTVDHGGGPPAPTLAPSSISTSISGSSG
jgi:RNA polymerase sigma factor (sigma-70 family)